jgi:hypothetical protein
MSNDSLKKKSNYPQGNKVKRMDITHDIFLMTNKLLKILTYLLYKDTQFVLEKNMMILL